jgi:hypothetical protein
MLWSGKVLGDFFRSLLGISTLLGKNARLKESRQSANVGRRAAIFLIALCSAS